VYIISSNNCVPTTHAVDSFLFKRRSHLEKTYGSLWKNACDGLIMDVLFKDVECMLGLPAFCSFLALRLGILARDNWTAMELELRVRA
jgi:hypothetical protein